jgi:hypothetical protein
MCKNFFDKTKQNCIFIRIEDTFKQNLNYHEL